MQDQPSLHAAISKSGIEINNLPEEYNYQVIASWIHSDKAAIWHFHSTAWKSKNLLSQLVQIVHTRSYSTLQRKVNEALMQPDPSPTEGIVNAMIKLAIKDKETKRKIYVLLSREGWRKSMVNAISHKLKLKKSDTIVLDQPSR
jgi:hypothetical protein